MDDVPALDSFVFQLTDIDLLVDILLTSTFHHQIAKFQRNAFIVEHFQQLLFDSLVDEIEFGQYAN